jgi:undecaprenyl-diphosphatase
MYIIAGLVQGITEWLPISSTAQDMLVMGAMGVTPEEAFSLAMFLHIGTLLAVVVKMRSEVRSFVVGLPNFRSDRLVQFLIVSTAVTAVVGVPVYLLLKEGLRSWDGSFVLVLLGLFLTLTGLFLYFSKKKAGIRQMSDVKFLDMVALGVVQGFTPLPGISRSGFTVAALLFRSIRQEDALRLSFLMSIPAVLGALFLEVAGGVALPRPEIVAGIVAALVGGYLTIDAMLKIAQKLRFDLFCIAFGLVALSVPLVTQAL